jgi:hypothetical protein
MQASRPGDIHWAGLTPTIANPTTSRAARKSKIWWSGPVSSQ